MGTINSNRHINASLAFIGRANASCLQFISKCLYQEWNLQPDLESLRDSIHFKLELCNWIYYGTESRCTISKQNWYNKLKATECRSFNHSLDISTIDRLPNVVLNSLVTSCGSVCHWLWNLWFLQPRRLHWAVWPTISCLILATCDENGPYYCGPTVIFGHVRHKCLLVDIKQFCPIWNDDFNHASARVCQPESCFEARYFLAFSR